MKKPFFKNSFFIYTSTFLLLLPIVFLPFITEKKSFIWMVDGLDQHYPMLMYYGKLLRGLLSGNGYPMVDFKLGLGFDTITTLNYYVLGDPITLLTVFMTSKNAVLFYDFLILLRFYLAGISFILFMKYWHREGLGTALGALIYVFSGYALYSGIKHPFFMNPMIYLPFILIGVEEVLRRKKPYLMIVMVFISAISNFYFFFDLTIITVIYILFRYFTLYRKSYKNTISGFFLTGLRTGLYYLLGTSLAAFLFLPVLYAFSQNGRLSNGPKLMTGFLLYSHKYYIELFQGMFAANVQPKSWTVLLFPAIILAGFVIILSDKKYRKLLLISIMVLLGLSVPAFGYMMNGFSYVANRWCFLFSFLTAVIFTMTYEKIFALNWLQKFLFIAGIAAYGIFTFAFTSSPNEKNVFYSMIIIAVLILILQEKYYKNKLLKNIVIFAIVIMNLGANGYALYASGYCNYASEFLSKKTVENRSAKGELALLSNIHDSSFYRVDTYGDPALNESLNEDYYGICGYYSLMDGNVTSYLKDMEDLHQVSAYRFHNFDNRTLLNEIASVKYFITMDKKAAPFGYKLINTIKTGNKPYYLFQNEYALPIGYTYENYILKADYDKLDALQKQNAMMKAVVLDKDTDYAGKSEQNVNEGLEKLPVKVIPNSKVAMASNKIHVKGHGARITLYFKSKPNSETYVRLNNIKIPGKISVSRNFDAIAEPGVNKHINVRSVYYNNYFGKDDYLINTGYSEAGKNQAVIRFSKKQSYTYDSIDVYSLDMKQYLTDEAALNKSVLRNIKETNNRIQGDITLSKQGIMALSIPYSRGWSAYVDGNKTNILKANVMYMALPLKAGNHHIVLKYETPFFKTGCLVSLAALIASIGMIIYHKKHNKVVKG